MNKREQLVLILTLIVSFCSICYELLLAQALSAFLENTVLRYSVTLGLYLFAMGIGARLVEGRVKEHPGRRLLAVEIALTFIGGFLMIWLYGLDGWVNSRLVLSICGHALILVIGCLSGMELPLLMEMLKGRRTDSESAVLGYSYMGAVLGTVTFAFVFFPMVGLLNTAFIVGLMNGCAGILLNFCRAEEEHVQRRQFYALLYIQLALAAVIGVCLIYSAPISEFLLQRYVAKGI